MKAISLWQPWASLWLCTNADQRWKLHETRHWHIKDQWKAWTPGERMAVHAAKRFEKEHSMGFADLLRKAFGPKWFSDLPTGAIIGTICVTECLPTTSVLPTSYTNLLSGDFSESRFAWRGEKPVLFGTPIPYRGAQGIFNVPDELIAQHARAA